MRVGWGGGQAKGEEGEGGEKKDRRGKRRSVWVGGSRGDSPHTSTPLSRKLKWKSGP